MPQNTFFALADLPRAGARYESAIDDSLERFSRVANMPPTPAGKAEFLAASLEDAPAESAEWYTAGFRPASRDKTDFYSELAAASFRIAAQNTEVATAFSCEIADNTRLGRKLGDDRLLHCYDTIIQHGTRESVPPLVEGMSSHLGQHAIRTILKKEPSALLTTPYRGWQKVFELAHDHPFTADLHDELDQARKHCRAQQPETIEPLMSEARLSLKQLSASAEQLLLARPKTFAGQHDFGHPILNQNKILPLSADIIKYLATKDMPLHSQDVDPWLSPITRIRSFIENDLMSDRVDASRLQSTPDGSQLLEQLTPLLHTECMAAATPTRRHAIGRILVAYANVSVNEFLSVEREAYRQQKHGVTTQGLPLGNTVRIH